MGDLYPPPPLSEDEDKQFATIAIDPVTSMTFWYYRKCSGVFKSALASDSYTLTIVLCVAIITILL